MNHSYISTREHMISLTNDIILIVDTAHTGVTRLLSPFYILTLIYCCYMQHVCVRR